MTQTALKNALTGKEYRLLEYLNQNKPNFVTTDEILKNVFNGGMSNVVTVYIFYLRKKSKELGVKISTKRHGGYALLEGGW